MNLKAATNKRARSSMLREPSPRGCNRNHSFRQRSYHRRDKFQQRVWISQDRAQLSADCTKSQLVRGGPISSKLNSYFNNSCFTAPPVIGADGIGTAFGCCGTGIVDGPDQANLDLAASKTFALKWPREGSTVEFRAEFFNAFNHPQSAKPDTNLTSPTFGVISSTAVNARVGQLALRLSFQLSEVLPDSKVVIGWMLRFLQLWHPARDPDWALDQKRE
jgi:hypothetical protein